MTRDDDSEYIIQAMDFLYPFLEIPQLTTAQLSHVLTEAHRLKRLEESSVSYDA